MTTRAADSRSLAELVRRHDRERYLTALFAPANRRAAMVALFAFNYEIARTREVVSEPMLGLIRLQWWREAIETACDTGKVQAHEVLVPLAAAIRQHRLDRSLFARMIDARERDLQGEPPANRDELKAYCESTSGALQLLVLATLGEFSEPAHGAVCASGAAYALAGLIRAIPFHARFRRQYIPRDLAETAGLELRDLTELRQSPALAAIAETLVREAERYLLKAREQRAKIPRAALPALLPARLATLHLRTLRRVRFNVFDPRLASGSPGVALSLTAAALTGRY